jgi:hypothetical protein
MTPKEKAEDLFNKMAFEVCLTEAKQCALIAVDEILNALDENQWQNKLFIDYWQEIKQEIEKL